MTNLLWGAVFLMTGLIMLLVNFNLLRPAYIFSLLRFWPLILIALGINLMVPDKKIKHIGTVLLAVLLTMALLAGVALRDHTWTARLGSGKLEISGEGISLPTLWSPNMTTQTITQTLTDDASELTCDISFGAGQLNIMATDEDAITAQLTGSGSHMADFTLQQTGKLANCELKQESSTTWVWGQPKNEWQLTFPRTSPPLTLNVETGASANQFDFAQLTLEKFTLDAGAADTHITFGNHAPELTADIKLGAAQLTIALPDNMEVILTHEGGLSDLNVPSTFSKTSGSRYTQTPADPLSKATITLSSGVSQINVTTYQASDSSTTDNNSTLPFNRLRYGAHSPLTDNGTAPRIQVLTATDITLLPLSLGELATEKINTHLIVLAEQGQQPTGGYRIMVQRAYAKDQTLTIEAEVSAPLRSDLVTQVLTTPYDLIAIAKSSLPAGLTRLTLVDQDGKTLAEASLGTY